MSLPSVTIDPSFRPRPTSLPKGTFGRSSPYGYVPTKNVAIIFIALFAFSTFIHTTQALASRKWWLLPTICFCGVMEILGWSGRLWSSMNPPLSTPFEIQITATILAPTPLAAANFVILGQMIRWLGTSYSRLTPKWYAIVFCTCDLISLIVQAVGGGMAAVAAGSIDGDPTLGGHIMLGGIIFQMFTITIYVFCAAEFFVRYLKNKPARLISGSDEKFTVVRGKMDGRLKLMSVALMFSTLCLFIRAIYRTIELSDGWRGRIIKTQVYFNVLDGAMIVLAMFTLNFIHPNTFLQRPPPSDDDDRTATNSPGVSTPS